MTPETKGGVPVPTTAFATVMSAQVAINAGASGPQLRGDPKELKRFLYPKGEIYRFGDSHK